MQNSCHKTPDTKFSLTNTNHHDAPEENINCHHHSDDTKTTEAKGKKKNPIIYFIFYM